MIKNGVSIPGPVEEFCLGVLADGSIGHVRCSTGVPDAPVVAPVVTTQQPALPVISTPGTIAVSGQAQSNLFPLIVVAIVAYLVLKG